MNKHGIKVGQELWFVPENKAYSQKSIEIERVGTKWGYPRGSAYRVNLESLIVEDNGGWHRGRCHLSEAAWRADQEVSDAWRSLRDAMSRRRRPEGISAKQIREAAALLGFALEEQK